MENRPQELTELCKPLFKYLKDNHNPHTKIIIDYGGAEVVSGEIYAPNTLGEDND